MHRRNFCKASAGLTGLALAGPAFAQAAPVVSTVEGTLRGIASARGFQFRGVRYADPQTQANRFRPPLALTPWTGVRDATKDGNSALQIHAQRPDFGGPFVTGSGTTTQSEDCLFLNVFTPALMGKRPVMFWCHGGGFASGGGTLPLYDGTNLSAFGDVVVVNVNHRLNAFGFATPTGEGTDGLSPNVGMLDLVAALRWVKRNIARFGGDPANVTIFGQSGGGAKVSTLLVMPEAQGLFHKAIVQSGSALTLAGRGNVVASTEQLAAKAGVPVAQLATIPAEQLLEALKDSANRFSPFVDGKVIARNPFDPDAPESVRTIPMMIGNTRTEASYTTDNTVFQLDDAGLRARTVKLIGEPAADALIAHYRTTHPGATPSLLYLLIATDVGTRRNGTLQAERKARQGGAPVYLYHFEWSTPVNDYWYSPHAIEIPFVFRNLAQVAPSIGAGPVQAALADKMSAAWVAFARTGNPSNRLGGTWPTYEPVRRQTMVFNTATRVVADPQGSDREAVFGTLGTKSVVRSLG